MHLNLGFFHEKLASLITISIWKGLTLLVKRCYKQN